MPKKIKLQEKKDTRTTPQASQKQITYEDCTGRIAFSKVCDRHCLLSDWDKKELKLLIDCFKKIESMCWKDIKSYNGFNYETIKHIAITPPSSLPPDATLKSLKLNDDHRLYGYRAQDTFNIIWFDKTHMVCPMNKQKKYAI